MLSMYLSCFYQEKEGGYSVIFPVLEIATCGDMLEEAMTMAVDCLAGYLYDAKLEKRTVPDAPEISAIDVDAVIDGESYESAFINLVTVDVAEYAKKHFEKSVKKTLTIPRYLSDLAIEKHINFYTTLQEALIQKLGE